MSLACKKRSKCKTKTKYKHKKKIKNLQQNKEYAI